MKLSPTEVPFEIYNCRSVWKVEIHPNSKVQEASANRVLGTRRVSAPFPRLPKAVLPISTRQIALPCPESLLCTATLLQLTTVLVLQLIDILPLAFAFSLFCLASMAHQVHHACQNPLTPLCSPQPPGRIPVPDEWSHLPVLCAPVQGLLSDQS